MKNKDEDLYDDIIHLPHPVSVKHPQMSMMDRAAQFSPFAALTGHDEAIKETARDTEQYMELDENTKEILDMRMQLIREHVQEHPEISILYFQPDNRKSGGKYIRTSGKVKKIDEFKQCIILENGISIPFHQIYELQGNLIKY